MMMLVFALALATGAPRPTVAILPPVAKEKADSWFGLALADTLGNRLLIHSRFDPKTLNRVYPLNVYGWRQVLAAARGEGVDISKPLSAEDVGRLQAQLGLTHLFFGAYTIVGKTARLNWQLVGPKAMASRDTPVALDKVGAAVESIAHGILSELGEKATKLGGRPGADLPVAAIRPFGQALGILSGQSLDPRAHLVLPPAEVQRAHTLLEATTKAAPDFERAWTERGIACAMLEKHQEAEEELVRAMAQSGEFTPSVALGLYYLYERQGDLNRAIKVLEEATTTHLGFLQGLGYLGRAYARDAASEKSLEIFTAYDARVPNNPWVRVMRARALSRTGKHNKAAEETKALLKEFSDSLMVHVAYASRLIDAGKHKEAKDQLEKTLAKFPSHPAVLTRLSYVELETGHARVALELAQKAVAALGTGRGERLAGYAHTNLAHALGILGRKAEAIKALKKAVALGISADDVMYIQRDPRMRDVLNDPRNPLP